MTTKLLRTLGFLLVMATAPPIVQATESVSGAGHITAGGESRTFAFVANTDDDGITVGELQLNNRALDSKTQADLNCLVISGSVATMSGEIQESTNFPAGTPIWVRVVDNGEGRNALADQITLVALFPSGGGVPCTQEVPLPLNDIEHGNIQVY